MAKGVIRRAKTLDDDVVHEALRFCDRHSIFALRDKLMFLLSVRLGLRAKEIAMLHVGDITNARGELSDTLFVSSRGGKYGKSRELPMTPDVIDMLRTYLKAHPGIRSGAMFFRADGTPMNADAARKMLKRIYDGLNLIGCSSHSGRRTFGTKMARNAMSLGGSLKDVAELMGHASTTSTEIYVEVSGRQREMLMMQDFSKPKRTKAKAPVRTSPATLLSL